MSGQALRAIYAAIYAAECETGCDPTFVLVSHAAYCQLIERQSHDFPRMTTVTVDGVPVRASVDLSGDDWILVR